MENKSLTGYPSIDKPWLKYYTEEAINAPLPECTMYEYVFRENSNRMQSVAFNYYGSKITYRNFFDRIKRTAAALEREGVCEGDVVTIASLLTPETIICIYALDYLGATANMIYVSQSEREILKTITATNSKLFFGLEILADKLISVAKQTKISCVMLEIDASMPWLTRRLYRMKKKKPVVGAGVISYTDWLIGGENAVKTPEAAPYRRDHAVMIVYTSGTTGEPKGVILGDNSLNMVVHRYRYAGWSYEKGDKMLTFMPPFLATGFILNVHMPLVLGFVSVQETNPDPQDVIQRFMKVRPNHFIATSAFAVLLKEKQKGKMYWLKSIGGGGDSLTIEQEKEFNDWLSTRTDGAFYCTGYGMTEFAATVTSNSKRTHRLGSLGVPLVNVNVKVVEPDTTQELLYNTEGELCFSTPSQMLGYLNADAAEQGMLWRENGETWIRTGDLGKVDEDGFVYFTGRLKRIYMVKGKDGTMYKLFPARIEAELKQHSNVENCAVIVKKDEECLHVPIVFVQSITSSNQDALRTELFEQCSHNLPSHCTPRKIVMLEKMPLTQSGKVDYRALEKQAQEQETSQ